MNYATLTQLTERYAERDLRNITDPNAQALDAERAQQALDDAAAEIDAHLAVRYTLPLVDATGAPLPPPQALVRCACDIAIYRLQTLRASDDIKDARHRYEDVMRLLRAIAKGEVALPGSRLLPGVADNLPAQSAGIPVFGQPPSIFSRRNRT
jgi:phage gp36-like protein